MVTFSENESNYMIATTSISESLFVLVTSIPSGPK